MVTALRISFLLASLTLGGCVFLAVHPTLVPSARGLESYTDYEAVVATDELRAIVRMEGYEKEGVGFIGPIIPVVPIAAGTNSGATMTVSVQLLPRTKRMSFAPGSLRLVVDEHAHAATTVTRPECGAWAGERIDPSMPLEIEGATCLRFFFSTVPLLHRSFVLTAERLPDIAYTARCGSAA
jgi:hypothetical protein